MEQAKLENLIVCLPTGSGKTYIAVMLIKEMSTSIRKSLEQGGKRTIFLVKTGRKSYHAYFKYFFVNLKFFLFINKVIILRCIQILMLENIMVT